MSQPSSQNSAPYQLRLHNSLGRTKHVLTPLDPERVTLYVCGPTVYNYIHIGNARPAVVFDVLYRVLRQLYPNVVYARNITDIDDKIYQAAKQQNCSLQEITDTFTKAYHQDLAQLGNLSPTMEPKATEHVPNIIAMVERLIASENAYVADGHVMFDVTSFEGYGQLSNRSLEDMLAGARVDPQDFKRHPGDFVLWKPSTGDWPGWDSPWGYGRPGWHIECSAMIQHHLGDQIDIHGGGQDLIFPHHENEIAQSQCACKSGQLAQIWMHNGYITMDDTKMSKSLGNVVTLRALLEQHPGEILRYALLSTHYRAPLNWSDEVLVQAKQNLDRLYQSLRSLAPLANADGCCSTERSCSIEGASSIQQEILHALCDDVNTPLALRELNQLAHQIQTTSCGKTRQRLGATLKSSANLLGLLQHTPDTYFQSMPGAIESSTIEALIDQRNAARAAKNYAKADAIRDQLLGMKVELEDSAEGTQWRFQ